MIVLMTIDFDCYCTRNKQQLYNVILANVVEQLNIANESAPFFHRIDSQL